MERHYIIDVEASERDSTPGALVMNVTESDDCPDNCGTMGHRVGPNPKYGSTFEKEDTSDRR